MHRLNRMGAWVLLVRGRCSKERVMAPCLTLPLLSAWPLGNTRAQFRLKRMLGCNCGCCSTLKHQWGLKQSRARVKIWDCRASQHGLVALDFQAAKAEHK